MSVIVLRSSTFLWIVNDKGFLYNVESGTSYNFVLDDPTIIDVCEQWDVLSNLYAAHYDASKTSETFNEFCKKIVDLSMGDIVSSDQIPISFPPRLKVKYSVETIKHLGRDLLSEPILPCLMRLVVFIGGNGDGKNWWKQSLYHMTSEEVLDAERLTRFLSLYNTPDLRAIDIIASDCELSILSVWINAMEPFKEKTRFIITSSDPFISSPEISLLQDKGYSLAIFCTSSYSEDIHLATNRFYFFPLRSIEDYQGWSTLMESASPELGYSFVPIADNNLDFFKEHIFLTEDEIRSQKLSYRDIFRHQELNVNQFGSFFIFPNGTIHPAADAPAIGTLEVPVHQTIIRELEENYAWRQTRRLMIPCNNCIYHDICPSPSVYERIFEVPGCSYWKD